MSKPVVLVTGASQGIGEAIAKVFAREIRGVRLALVGSVARIFLASSSEICVTASPETVNPERSTVPPRVAT